MIRRCTTRLLARTAILLALASACSSVDDIGAIAQPLLTGPTIVLASTGFGDDGITLSAPPADMPSGSVAWCCGTTAWWLPLPVVAGDTVSSISVQVEDNGSLNGSVTGGFGGNNIMVSLFARPTSGGSDTPIGPVTAYATSDGTGHAQTLAFTLPTPYQVPTGVTVLLRALASSGYPLTPTKPSAIGPATVTPFVAPPPPPRTTQIMYNMALAHPATFAGSNSVLTIAGETVELVLGTVSTVDDYLPVALPVGSTIVSWKVWAFKESSGPTISFRFRDSNLDTFLTSRVGDVQSSSLNNPGVITLGQGNLSVPVTEGHSFFIAARSGGTDSLHSQDRVLGYSVTVIPPQ